METAINKTHTLRNATLPAMALIFGCIGLLCAALHISPWSVLEELVSFASHHYLIAGFISLVLCLTLLKLHYADVYGRHQPKPASRISGAGQRAAIISDLKKSIVIAAQIQETPYVRKEKIPALSFSTEELLFTEKERENRREALQNAMVLGNLYKQKVILFFEDRESAKHTLCTTWHVDEEHVSLKGGATIPVQRIYRVEI